MGTLREMAEQRFSNIVVVVVEVVVIFIQNLIFEGGPQILLAIGGIPYLIPLCPQIISNNPMGCLFPPAKGCFALRWLVEMVLFGIFITFFTFSRVL